MCKFHIRAVPGKKKVQWKGWKNNCPSPTGITKNTAPGKGLSKQNNNKKEQQTQSKTRGRNQEESLEEFKAICGAGGCRGFVATLGSDQGQMWGQMGTWGTHSQQGWEEDKAWSPLTSSWESRNHGITGPWSRGIMESDRIPELEGPHKDCGEDSRRWECLAGCSVLGHVEDGARNVKKWGEGGKMGKNGGGEMEKMG